MSPKMVKADVVIVGGGPAGSAAAIQCARSGLQVSMVEQAAFPRHRPGETLHPGIEPLLDQLGVAQPVLSAGFLRHRGHWVQWSGDRRFVPFGEDATGPWMGFQAWRSEFDQRLLQQARVLGVKVWQPCRAIRPIVESNQVAGVFTSAGPLYANFVIDAAGSRHWLARQLGLSIDSRSPRLVAHYGYAEGSCSERDQAPAIVADTHGWTWTARVQPRLYQWTRLLLTPTKLAPDFLPPEFHALIPQPKRHKANVTWRMANNLAGPGYFLIGDAATVLDPASSHGVLKALMSGIMAGHLIAQRLRHNRSRHSVTQGYCQWVCDWFNHDVNKLKVLYHDLPNPPIWV
ncbi:MAG: tryptophan 7-halogenase [Pseudanabaenales cyanobacterium]|nr:tryptophan 7-halogenase [Pseudanabaenales cyanobacterium]